MLTERKMFSSSFVRPPPINPFYLTVKAREFDFPSEFIELAGKVNQDMPYFCRSFISQALNHGEQKSLSSVESLVLGVAYKRDIGDMRESPALKLIDSPAQAGAELSYHDPQCARAPGVGPHSMPARAKAYDAVVIVTAHAYESTTSG